MIVNVRGSSGAGKSYIGHELLRLFPVEEELWVPVGSEFNKNKTKEKTIGYLLPGDLVVLGRYNATCGGVEGMPTAKTERNLVYWAATRYRHVYFEGLFLSLSYGPWVKLHERLKDENVKALPFQVLVLNTPMAVCETRVIERSARTQLNRDATIVKNWNRIHKNVKPGLERGGIDCRYIEWTHSVEAVIDWFHYGGWRP